MPFSGIIISQACLLILPPSKSLSGLTSSYRKFLLPPTPNLNDTPHYPALKPSDDSFSHSLQNQQALVHPYKATGRSKAPVFSQSLMREVTSSHRRQKTRHFLMDTHEQTAEGPSVPQPQLRACSASEAALERCKEDCQGMDVPWPLPASKG